MIDENPPALAVHEIGIAFGGLRALASVSFAIHGGENLAVIGPNGAGKSTLLNVLSGFARPSQGTASFADQNLLTMRPVVRARAGLGRTFQSPRIVTQATVWQNVMMGTFKWNRSPGFDRLFRKQQYARARDRVAALLEELGLARTPHQIAGDLPYGQQKILELARVLAGDPTVVLLDEPLAGLSEDEADRMIDVIASVGRAGAAIVMIEHHLAAVARLSERALVLHHGRQIALGDVETVFRSEEVHAAYTSSRGTPTGDANA